MKSIRVILVIFLAALTSCEKLNLPDETTDSPKGNLTLTIYQIEQMPFTSTRAVASDICTRINFLVYDEEGKRIQNIIQKVGDSDFGTTTIQLDPGNYRIVALAHSSSGNPTSTNPAQIKFTNTTGYTDTFFYSESITIDDEHLTLSLTLKRIVALCRFIINDAIPTSVAELEFEYTGGSGAFDAATGLGSVKSTQKMTFLNPQGQKEFDLYTFLHDLTGTIKLKVTATDNSANVIQQREFDIPLQQNQITRFTGTFFSGESDPTSRSASLSVTLNTKWNGENTINY